MSKKIKEIQDCTKEELLEMLADAAKNWLAHDGLWFQQVESQCGMDTAIKLDAKAWEKFTVIEAKRIMERHGIRPGGGIPALIQALQFRLYAYINKQEIIESGGDNIIFRMNNCRVQEARRRKNLPAFSCKPVGLVEYTNFAKTIDARIKTKCISCPPGKHPQEFWCSWEFSI